MPNPSINKATALQQVSNKIRETSLELAAACEHIGAAMRTTYIQLAEAVEAGNAPKIAELVSRIQNSDLVTGVAGKFHHLREEATELWNGLLPWAKVIFGLVVGLAGYFLAAELGLVLAAILMIGGFWYAAINAQSAVLRRGLD